jgi:hypothetical protein
VITYEAADGTIVLVAEEFLTASMERQMLATASPKAASSLLRGFAGLRAEEARLNELATAEQRAITWGDCVTRQYGELTIWGVVQPLSLIEREERVRGATSAEVIELRAALAEGFGRGWRYGRWHSADVPEGEYGAAHVADLHRITADEFDAAQFRGWTP